MNESLVSQFQNILVIDDEPNLRRSLSLILQQAGYKVVAAASAEEARVAMQDCMFDLIFLDLKMPDINGMDLLPEIRRMYPDLPVLILTAHATMETAIEAVRKGARDYLLKPVDPERIIDRIQHILGEQQQPKRRREIMEGITDLLAELNRLEGLPEFSYSIEVIEKKGDPDRYIQRGPITLDVHTRQASVSGRFIPLSPTAFEYLVTLVKHSPNVISCEDLVAESQGYAAGPVEAKEMARWRIHELRKVLEPDSRHPRYIITVRGTGYRLVL